MQPFVLVAATLSGSIVLAGQLDVRTDERPAAPKTGADAEPIDAPSAPPAPVIGPDVIYSDCTAITYWGEINGTRAYSLGSHTCNIGDENLLWGNSHMGTPVLGMNAYRLSEGRLMQIGMSWAKHGTGAAAGNGCGLNCNGMGGSVLGAGCRDIYGSVFNGSQSILGPRSDVNAYTGELLPAPAFFGSLIDRRIRIDESEIDSALHPDALYFLEGVYVALDDASIFGNADNNASYKRFTIGDNLLFNPTGQMNQMIPAINAWRDHGNGVDTPDPSVQINNATVPGEGRFVVANKVTDNGNGTWTYDYALFNLSSDRSAGGFTVSIPIGVSISDVGFHDVDYHSGEIYDNTDWTTEVLSTSVSWRSPQTYVENPDSNALRWGTMYNFWFTADGPPIHTNARITLFKPGEPVALNTDVSGPSAACAADLDGDEEVGFSDLLQMLAAWGPCAACPEDIDGDGEVGFADLLAVLAAWGPC